MSRPENIVAIDQGGQSTRAVVFDRHGRLRHRAQVEVSTLRPGPGRVEHDADELAASIERVVADAVDVAGAGVAGLATQRSSIACWDRETGAALAPVLSWQDRRGADLLARLAPDSAFVRRTTGLVVSAHYGASKLRWCLEQLEPVRSAARDGRLAAGPLSSFLACRMTGGQRRLVDPANASRTLLWDITTGDWSQPLLDAFGIERETLPRCVPNRFDFGTVTGHRLPLRVCTGDQGAAIFAHGPLDTDRVYVNVGTGAFVLAPVAQLPADTPLLRSVIWDDGDEALQVLEGTVNGAASALAAFAPHADRRAMQSAAQRIGAGGMPLFLNGVGGLGSPFWRELDSRLVGSGDAGARLTAILESILFLLQANLEQVPGMSVRTIVISGGLSGHDGLCAGLASLSGCVVERSDDTEATARGLAALVAGLPADWLQLPLQRFEPANCAALTQRYRRWRELLDAELADSGDATDGAAP